MKLCLIGSSRFMDQYRAVNKELTLLGHVVYTIATISTSIANESDRPSDEEKIMLDLVHLRKIQESDAVVLVTDETGYYGDSTKRELMWAQMLGKSIYFPDDLSRRPRTFDNDFREFAKARSSKDPQAMQRYYERIQGNGIGLVGAQGAQMQSSSN